MPVQNRIQFRRGTAGAGSYQWASEVLYAGEVGYETDTGKFKIGDGSTIWSSLPYATILPSELTELVQDIIGSSIVGSSGVNISYNDTSGNTTISLSDPTVQASGVTGLNEAIDDRVNDLLIAGSNIQLNYNDNANNLTITVTGVSISGHSHTASNITNFNESVDDRVATLLVGSGPDTNGAYNNIVFSYEDDDVFSDQLSIGLVRDLIGLTSISSSGGGVATFSINASNINATGNLTIGGDLTVNGTTTTVNSTTISVDDKNLELGSTNSPTDLTADGGGITLKGATDKEFKWINSSSSWTSSEHINVGASGLTYKLNGTTVIANNVLGASGYALASGMIIDGGTP